MLNDIALKNIKSKNHFLFEHLDDFHYMHNSFIDCVNKLPEPVNNIKTAIDNNISIDIARRIIKSFNLNYISNYNDIVANNNIVFDRNNHGSRFTASDWNDKNTWKLIIEDKNNYSNVISIIHEFMHYTNRINGTSFNRDMFGEFISIFFEKKAEQFLLENNISEQEIGTNDRLFNTYNFLSIAYEEGKNYFDSNLDDITYSNRVNAYFKHLLGLLLCEWAIKNNIDIEKMIYLNNNINKFEKTDDIFKYLGIDDLKQLTDESISIIADNIKNDRTK